MRRGSFEGDEDEDRSSGSNTSGSSFTKKLYEILDSADATDIVCWTAGDIKFSKKNVLSDTST